MEKLFNVAGPCFPADHSMLPALDRLPQIRRLVNQEGVARRSDMPGLMAAFQSFWRENSSVIRNQQVRAWAMMARGMLDVLTSAPHSFTVS